MIHLIHTKPKANGVQIITGESGTVQSDTVCCVHCRHHWVVKPGSNKKRGFCMKCMGPTCGNKQCDNCVPYMKMIENIEKTHIRTAN